jgi:hypothetical protein
MVNFNYIIKNLENFIFKVNLGNYFNIHFRALKFMDFYFFIIFLYIIYYSYYFTVIFLFFLSKSIRILCLNQIIYFYYCFKICGNLKILDFN